MSTSLCQPNLRTKRQQHFCHVPLILHSLTRRSSPAETIRGRVGWKDTQFTPRSWPSRTNFTTASVFPNMSAWLGLLEPSDLRTSLMLVPNASFAARKYPKCEQTDQATRKRLDPPSDGTARTSHNGCGPSLCRLELKSALLVGT